MSRFRQYYSEVPENFGVSVVEGTSMTIPGQGSDLAQIIASIVKLPPLDERTFDEVDVNAPGAIDRLLTKAELETLYKAEGRNLAEDALERQKQRKAAKEAAKEKEKEKEPETTTTTPTPKAE